jgi:hypothetical protein
VRQITDRGEDETTERDNERPEADHDPVNPPLHRLKPHLEAQFKLVQVLFGGDVVVNGVEDLGGDPLRGVARNSSPLKGPRESEPIRHWARGKGLSSGRRSCAA